MIKPNLAKEPNIKKDPWKLAETFSNYLNEPQEALSYSPYYDAESPFILSMECTTKSILLLLKNGNIVRFGTNASQLNQNQHHNRQISNRIDDVYLSFDRPQQIKIPTKVIDISCGYEHCLARGRDCKIFSWGINSYGQLGLENCNVGFSSEKVEPDYIPKLSQYKILQIYAIHYNSFCIADDNSIFGFGNNDQGQIKTSGETKIAIPEKMNILDPKVKDFRILINKKGKDLYYSEIMLPSKSFEKSLKKQLDGQKYEKEFKLKAEIRYLKEQLNQFRIKVTVEDFKNLIQDIHKLKIKYEEKANKMGRKNLVATENKNLVINPIKIFDKQIEYFQNKKPKVIDESLNPYLSMIDERALQDEEKKKKKQQDNDKDKVKSIDTDKDKERDKEKTPVLLFTKYVPQLSTLIERVSSEIQVQKYRYIDSNLKENESNKLALKKSKENIEYVALFNQVIEEIENKIEKLYDKDTFEESESIKLKCSNEYQNFKMNTLNELTVSNLDLQTSEKPTLNDFIKMSLRTFQKTLEKMKNLKVNDHSNKIGQSILDAFNNTLFLAHQNNYLLSFLLNNQVVYVNKNTLEKALEKNNPKNFVELKEMIDTLKKAHEESEVARNSRDDNNKVNNTNNNSVNSYHSKRINATNRSVNKSELLSDDEDN